MKTKVKRLDIIQPENTSVRFIAITKRQIAIVDADVYESFSLRKWHAVGKGSSGVYYAAGPFVKNDGTRIRYPMHRQVVGISPGDPRFVDHINGNTLDNRRENLRIVSALQNSWNRGKRKGKSQFKGVSPQRWGSEIRYGATIRANGKRVFLGWSAYEEGAARRYDEAALEYFGEYARLNFPRVSHMIALPVKPVVKIPRHRFLREAGRQSSPGMTAKDIAKYLSLSVQTIRKLIHMGKLKAGPKIGLYWKIDTYELDDFMEYGLCPMPCTRRNSA